MQNGKGKPTCNRIRCIRVLREATRTVIQFLLVDRVVVVELDLNQRVRTTARAIPPINEPKTRPLIAANHGREDWRAILLYHSKKETNIGCSQDRS